ncbi:MAG: class I SAM-dependent methyltransferase [Oscillospiraceae bacterium]|nr:class I SAM-dependent methyltransferase [Oscillospiraceae bacterium]
MYTLEACEKEWDAVGRHGSGAERMERAKLWLPYYAYLAEQERGKPFQRPNRDNDMVSALVQSGKLRGGDSVLDVGAGMGGYALELARHCKSVTALDVSEPCLGVLRERAKQCGLDNVSTVCGAWEEYSAPERFDMVFSAMCPAICNTEELRRMEAASADRCCLITVMRGSVDKHRRAMMTELNIRPSGGMVTEAIHYYNALYLMGRRPEVTCRTVERSHDITEETLLTQYPVYFKIFGVSEQDSAAFLKKYLALHGDRGVLHEESVLNLAMITWKKI